MILLAAGFVLAAIVIMRAGRGTTYYYDDWAFVTMRLGWDPHTLLYPHNEHLSLLPVIVYKTVFETLGLDHYEVLRAVSVALNLTCGGLLFVYVRRRLGDWVALGLALALVVMGAAAYDIVWPFQIGFLGSLAASLGTLLALDRGTRRGDAVACLLICIALSSSSLGVMLLAGVIVEVAIRPDRLRRLWIPAIPAFLYGLWYLKYGTGQLNLSGGLPKVPTQISQGLRGGVEGATGVPAWISWLPAVVVAESVVYALVRPKRSRARLLAIIVLPLTFWGLEALARTGLPATEGRYMYPNGLYVDLVAAEALIFFSPRLPVGMAIAALLGVSAIIHTSAVYDLGAGLRQQAVLTRSVLTVAEMLRLPAATALDDGQPQLYFGLYQAAATKYGSTIAWEPSELPTLPPRQRAVVDIALRHLMAPDVRPLTGPAPKGCRQFPGARRSRRGIVRARQIYVRANRSRVEVRLRRFGDVFTRSPQVVVRPRTAGVIRLPRGGSPKPWITDLRSAATFEACQG